MDVDLHMTKFVNYFFNEADIFWDWMEFDGVGMTECNFDET